MNRLYCCWMSSATQLTGRQQQCVYICRWQGQPVCVSQDVYGQAWSLYLRRMSNAKLTLLIFIRKISKLHVCVLESVTDFRRIIHWWQVCVQVVCVTELKEKRQREAGHISMKEATTCMCDAVILTASDSRDSSHFDSQQTHTHTHTEVSKCGVCCTRSSDRLRSVLWELCCDTLAESDS